MKHQGKGSPPRPRTGRSVTRSHLTVASGPASISHCPLDGEVLWVASAGGRGASRPPHHGQARQGRRGSPSGQLEGPARPQTHRRAPPSWAFHTDAINTTVQKCNKHKAAKQNPDLQTGEECGPSLSECVLEREPPRCSLVLSLRRVLTRSRRMKRLVIHLASD